MSTRVIELKRSVFESNDERAELLRGELKDKGIFLLNLMILLQLTKMENFIQNKVKMVL